MNFHIAVIPGDGIGPEIMDQALLVLKEIGSIYHHEFRFSEVMMGGCAIDKKGEALPQEDLTICLKSDAVLLGAVGGEKWDHLPGDQRPERGLLRLRKELGSYANIRPAVLYKELKDACPLKSEIIGEGIDLCVVRELTGGIYFGEKGRRRGTMGEQAYDIEIYSETEIESIARTAFEVARKRNKKVTSIDKANVLESSRLWRSVMEKVAGEYDDVVLNHMYIDNAAMQLIKNPSQFDVIVTTNMFGDILSDEASMITGSIGILPSASLGEGKIGIYEPIHGSAPDIAGLDLANPIGMILSAAMMLRYSFDLESEAKSIENAVVNILGKNIRTRDIMGEGMHLVGTKEMGKLIADELR
ncbi:3-isopropylmalate dehydrogenase [Anaerosolibacter carboniphilus]|nr:3-isopropylmalate dehydrogenase [Anaerosolibacter carboniphilus]